ncbi:tetraacyldisaccharide 4'-kinase [Rurimicrobium arvi]|uniref:Tetraacyldisaccharide 4'-kinase n=1 Tax=Rurimicrobium arvi TaxID=2049916 RepID=A0ABP8MUR6_9BACT
MFLLRYLLLPFTLLYGSLVWLRNRLYDAGFLSSVSFDIPVIAVGNLSVGGTGKTPHIEYLVRLLQYEYRVATMSRGYKRRTRGFLLADERTNALHIGDEPMQYHLKFPELAVSVAEDRMTGIPSLLMHRPEIEVVLLDDAFQHRSVRAGLNVLITDYNKPFYKDHILPYGSLRESRNAYKRADLIVVSKCPPSLTTAEAADIRSRIAPSQSQQVCFSRVRYGNAYRMGSPDEAVSFAGKKVLLLTGIAKPEPLLAHVEQQAAAVHLLSHPDHHFFTARNFAEVEEVAKNWGGDCVVLTTEKDATRLALRPELLSAMSMPVYVMPIEVAFLFNDRVVFDQRVREFVQHQSMHYQGLD